MEIIPNKNYTPPPKKKWNTWDPLPSQTILILMSILKNKLETCVLENSEIKDNQQGFTKGTRIKDNLLIWQYCVENIYRNKRPLTVTSVDYTKALDSIKRESMIEAMKEYNVHDE